MISKILELSQNDELGKATKLLNRKLDEVMKVPAGPKRWRAVVKVLHDTNPVAGEDDNGFPLKFRQVNEDCIVANRIWRETAEDKFGRSKDHASNRAVGSGSSFRGYLSMPRIVKTTIEIVDPEAFKTTKNAKKMFKEFKEYQNAEVY